MIHNKNTNPNPQFKKNGITRHFVELCGQFIKHEPVCKMINMYLLSGEITSEQELRCLLKARDLIEEEWAYTVSMEEKAAQ